MCARVPPVGGARARARAARLNVSTGRGVGVDSVPVGGCHPVASERVRASGVSSHPGARAGAYVGDCPCALRRVGGGRGEGGKGRAWTPYREGTPCEGRGGWVTVWVGYKPPPHRPSPPGTPPSADRSSGRAGSGRGGATESVGGSLADRLDASHTRDGGAH